MTEETVVDGKPATVVYMTRNWIPVPKEQAELVRVLWADGSSATLTKTEAGVSTAAADLLQARVVVRDAMKKE